MSRFWGWNPYSGLLHRLSGILSLFFSAFWRQRLGAPRVRLSTRVPDMLALNWL